MARPRNYAEDDDDVDEPRSKAAQQAKRNCETKQYVFGLEEKVNNLETLTQLKQILSDHSYTKNYDSSAEVGMCLHVVSGDISLELCSI